MALDTLDPTPGADKWNAQGYPKINAAINKINDIDEGLPGGTTNQILKKSSNADYNYAWQSIADETDVTKATTATSNGLGLDTILSAGSPYTIGSIVYRYDYTLFKKMCHLSFSVTFAVSDGANITEFQIPLPNGIDKDTAYRFFGSGFYISDGTTKRIPLAIRSYKDGSEGQRLVIVRADGDDTGDIVSSTSSTVLIEGHIHFITT